MTSLRLPLVVLLALLLPFSALAAVSARHCDEQARTPATAMMEHCADMQDLHGGHHGDTSRHPSTQIDDSHATNATGCHCAQACAGSGLPSFIATAASIPVRIEAPTRAVRDGLRPQAASRPFRPPALA